MVVLELVDLVDGAGNHRGLAFDEEAFLAVYSNQALALLDVDPEGVLVEVQVDLVAWEVLEVGLALVPFETGAFQVDLAVAAEEGVPALEDHSGGPVVHSTVADWELEEGTDDSEEAHRAAACEGVPAYAGPDSHDVEAFAACQGEAFDAREVPYQVSCLAVGPASSFLAVLADQHAAYSFLDVGLLSGFEVEEQVAF